MSSKPPKAVEIFIDRSLGRKIALPLAEAGAIVHLHDDHFAQDAEDQQWLTEVGKRGWLVLTKDQRIRYRPLEREALLNANVKAFCFMSGNVTFAEMAEVVSKALPSIIKIANKYDPPFIAGIYKDAIVKIVFPSRK